MNPHILRFRERNGTFYFHYKGRCAVALGAAQRAAGSGTMGAMVPWLTGDTL